MSVEVIGWNLAIAWLTGSLLVHNEIKSGRLEILVGGKYRNCIGVTLAPMTLLILAMVRLAKWRLRKCGS